MTALLISVENIKRLGLTQENVNDKLIAVAIKDSQELKIREVIGEDLYTALMQRVTNNDVTGNYAVLMNEYIAPCMVKYVDYYTSIYSNQKITNKATGTIQDNNIRTDNGSVVDFLDVIEKQAMNYRQRLINWLEKGLIPEYPTTCKDKRSGYDFNWV
jgi:hypothetical protein